MLKNAHLLVLQGLAAPLTKALAHLPEPLRTEVEAAAVALQNMVTDALAHRASLPGRPQGGGRGRPATNVYVIDLDGYGTRHAVGGAAAVDIVNEELKVHKVKGLLTLNNLNVQLSTKGEWHRVLATDNGDRAIAVRKLAGAAAAKVLASRAAQAENAAEKSA